MKIKQTIHITLLSLFVAVGLATWALPAYVSADQPSGITENGKDSCGGVKTAIIHCSESGGKDVQNSGILGILKLVIRILAIGVGVVAVAGIGWGAIQYATAQDNAGQINEAISIIRNVIIGLVAFAFMTVFLNFIVPGGVL